MSRALLGAGADRYPDTLPEFPTLGTSLSPTRRPSDRSSPPDDDHDDEGHHHHHDRPGPDKAEFESKPQRSGGEGGGEEAGGAEEAGGKEEGDWHWQCHVCAHLNPLPLLYRDFGAVPGWVSQPCGNRLVEAELALDGAMDGAVSEAAALAAVRERMRVRARVGVWERGRGMGGSDARSPGPGLSPCQQHHHHQQHPPIIRADPFSRRAARGSTYVQAVHASRIPSTSITNPASQQQRRQQHYSHHQRQHPQPSGSRTASATATGSPSPSWSPLPSVPSSSSLPFCPHRRCEGCYDIDASHHVLRFSSGGAVRSRLYERWRAAFRWGGGGGDGAGYDYGHSDGWVEDITFIHRGGQEGGGCSESGGDDDCDDEDDGDEGADGDDEAGDSDEVSE